SGTRSRRAHVPAVLPRNLSRREIHEENNSVGPAKPHVENDSWKHHSGQPELSRLKEEAAPVCATHRLGLCDWQSWIAAVSEPSGRALLCRVRPCQVLLSRFRLQSGSLRSPDRLHQD